jgi:predicted transcriptional regulator
MMLLSEIRDLLNCEVFTGEERMDTVCVQFGCASDLMSDVLAFSRAGAVLLTGLVNIQTVQTAFVAEIDSIVIVRGKRPAKDVVALAQEKRIHLLGTPYSMYEACGKLYRKGLVSTMDPVVNGEHHARA